MATRLTPTQKLKLSRKIKKIREDHPEYSDKKVLAVAYSYVKKGRK
jgi:hypothetical protein